MALYPLLRPILFRLDAERAHALAIVALRCAAHIAPRAPAAPSPRLAVRVAGIDFASPVGVAAGLDKDAVAVDGLLGRGFGFVEVGTLTPLPQVGNARPRLFRLAADRAVINRMGFNNRGQAAAHARLAARRRRDPSTALGTGPSTALGTGPSTALGTPVVGVNIGANKDAVDRVGDYAAGVRAMADVADYLTINISSPNTPGLRALQGADALGPLLEAVMAARPAGCPPIVLKVAPDLDPAGIDAVARAAIDHGIAALIVANTTVSRPPLHSPHVGEAGGLSGAPLKALALARLRDFRAATGGAMPLIAAGGIESAADAYARLRAGASLVQLYSALVYEGPGLGRRIAAGLDALLARDGFACVADAVGADAAGAGG